MYICVYVSESPCLNITSLSLTESEVMAGYQVLNGMPDTLFLSHSSDRKNFTIISEGVNVSRSLSGKIYANYSCDLSKNQYFQLIAYEQSFQSSTNCSAIFDFISVQIGKRQFILIYYAS